MAWKWPKLLEAGASKDPGFAFFALVAFLTLSFAGAAVYLFREGRDLGAFALLAFAALPVVLAFVLVRNATAAKLQGKVNRASSLPPSSQDDVLKLETWKSLLVKARAVSSEPFQSLLNARLRDATDNMREWAQGHIKVTTSDYTEMLKKASRTARESIFCTSDVENRRFWQGEEGRAFLEYQASALRAPERDIRITRVFVFQEPSDITPEDIAIMRLQERGGICVFGYINVLDEDFSFPPDMRPDFCIVDEGESVGVTHWVSSVSQRASWYFSPSPAMRREFLSYRDKLERTSPGRRSVDECTALVDSSDE